MWNSWTTEHQAYLLPLDNAEVRQRASRNTVLAPEGDLPTLVAPTIVTVSEDSVASQILTDDLRVLIAEIPRAKNRWKQANFVKEDYEHFFGAREGTRRLLVFRHANDDATMAGDGKNRSLVTGKRRNFRLKLVATACSVSPAVRQVGS